ncbi:MAG TPA: TIM-barrel domain-containing protein [Candidatus Paceibacterota bacterium]|nr:TIM-barrel domain-containing protein [Candidatus Paceibacterota bacterium]
MKTAPSSVVRHSFLSILTLLTSATLAAAAPEVVLKSAGKRDGMVQISVGGQWLVLRPLNESAIRVRFSNGVRLSTPDFVLLTNLPATKFTVREDKESITVATAKIRAVVDRATAAIRFCNSAGEVFLAERPATREFKPVVVRGQDVFEVGQEFESNSGEKLFGLGQFQDGLWDWRGMPIELRQLNTQIAVPMLVSSRGYGLLWNNASRTDFNLPGDRIPLTVASGSDSASGPSATEQLTAANSGPRRGVSDRRGQFTSGEAGEYVFCTRDGDRRNEIAILVDGVEIAGIKNMWTPRAIVGKISLPANKTCEVVVRGGGRDVKLFARPLASTTTFHSDCGDAVDYVAFYGPELDDVIAGYRAATGAAPLWPKWAYGFWQCRERYSSQKQLVDTAAEFRRRQIPVDLIVQDWQYWGNHGWGAYEWDLSHYPDPATLITNLHDLNVKFMISVWCNPQGKTLADLRTNNMVVNSWIDVFSPVGRAIRWKHLNEAFASIGMDAWWGDATEPGDPGTELLGKKVSLGLGDQFTSAYPLFASQSIYEGQRATVPEKRVVTFTRSAFPGIQRYGAAAWSGDINGDWTTFKRQIPAGLNFCLAGLPYWTTDCAGFFRPPNQYDSTDYNELLTRWFEWGTFCPILRVHGYGTSTEFWHWLPATQTNLLAYDRLRYRMLPYNYSVAWNVTSRGGTIMRALGMDFPGDARAWTSGHEYMFGPAFLVAPVTEAKATHWSVYLPGGTSWVNFWTGETERGGREVQTAVPLETLPLFVRAGSIVPLGPDLQFALEKPADPVELRVYRGADGSFTLYEDEGDNYNYEKGHHATIPISWNEAKQTLEIGKRTGKFQGMLKERTFNIVWVSAGHGTKIGPDEKPDAVVHYGGRALKVKGPAR